MSEELFWYVGAAECEFLNRQGRSGALVGENGAGKSTLKNILCGLVAPDEGAIVFEGQEFSHLTTSDARDLGIAAIHQELSLFPNLSVAENIYIGVGSLPTHHGLVDIARMRAESRRLLGEVFQDPLDPSQPVSKLSLGERQLVEVAKALRRASTLLILDEPTTSLSLPERRRLFDVVRGLRQRGYALVYITHFLEEVYELADRIVVLRDGRIVETGTPQEIDRRRLTQLMVGRELAETTATWPPALAGSSGPQEVLLRLSNVSDEALLRDINLDLHAARFWAWPGLMGAGRSELAEAIFGIRLAHGSVEIKGNPSRTARRRARRRAAGARVERSPRRPDFPGGACVRTSRPRFSALSPAASASCRRAGSARRRRS